MYSVIAIIIVHLLGGVKALSFWRNGKCAGFATTWEFCLGKISKLIGPFVAEQFEKRVAENWQQWSRLDGERIFAQHSNYAMWNISKSLC